MNILADIKQTLTPLGIPLETGVFTDTAPDTYIVAVPMSDRFALNADDAPSYDVQEARVSLYSKGNYLRDKNRIIRSLLGADFTITGRQYIGFETETAYISSFTSMALLARKIAVTCKPLFHQGRSVPSRGI